MNKGNTITDRDNGSCFTSFQFIIIASDLFFDQFAYFFWS